MHSKTFFKKCGTHLFMKHKQNAFLCNHSQNHFLCLKSYVAVLNFVHQNGVITLQQTTPATIPHNTIKPMLHPTEIIMMGMSPERRLTQCFIYFCFLLLKNCRPMHKKASLKIYTQIIKLKKKTIRISESKSSNINSQITLCYLSLF